MPALPPAFRRLARSNLAAPALLPALVSAPVLGQANRWLELARSTAFAAGPALGGALFGAIHGMNCARARPSWRSTRYCGRCW